MLRRSKKGRGMRLQFVGSGDAFGSGGRLNTCFHVRGTRANFLIDCGATSLVGMKRLGIDRNAIDTILITHFHADHFGGVPFFILDAQFVAKRTQPLTIAGPPGIAEWYERVMEASFSGAGNVDRRFAIDLRELAVNDRTEVNGLGVHGLRVAHSDAVGPCLGFRVEAEGKIVAYSGDTEWTEALIEIGRDADLFVCECYTYERSAKLHLSLAQLEARLPEIRPRRLVITHMSEDMLGRRADVRHETADDGKIVEF
jgi:ribonuclease BN (tRNA processing enzyme)